MRNLTEGNITEAVLNQLGAGTDPRLKQVMSSLIRHLHAFVREVELTEAEWAEGIRFLTEAAAMTDDKRNEFILASDVLGVSILVDAMTHRKPAGTTESSVLGPFYRDGAATLPFDSTIANGEDGVTTVISGQVTDDANQPIIGATLDIWQTGSNGLYENQDPDQPDMNLRGKFETDSEGRYQFRTILPVSYGIPTDGPVGRMLKSVGRHAFRPAHIHFKVSAPGHEPLTTMLFVEGDPYLDSDVVFGVKNSLVAHFDHHETDSDRLGVTAPYYTAHYDFGLAK